MTRRSRFPQAYRPETPELRTLLAVKVSVNAGNGVLKIRGTRDADEIDIDEFQAAAIFDGDDDNDTLFRGVGNLFAVPEVIENFETVV